MAIQQKTGYVVFFKFDFICFYGIPTIVGYLMPNPANTYIYIYIYIYIIWEHFLDNFLKKVGWVLFSHTRQYCYIDALHGRWLSVWRLSWTTIAKECCELYWTSPGGNIPQSSSWTDTYHPSRKSSEQGMWDNAGEVRTNHKGCVDSFTRTSKGRATSKNPAPY